MEVFLKQNVVAEPLVDNWYAWPHLISPATAAMNVLDRHLKIINSYLLAPELHYQAVRNPKLLGGPFMDFDGEKRSEVELLKKEILEKQADVIAFAKAVRELSALLKEKADGSSLESLYPEIPDVLRGYVELYYDIHNQASFRFYESLLYRSRYYKPDLQHLSMYLIDSDERPFILSTPRLPSETSKLNLKVPFNSTSIDALFRMQRTPASYERIKNLFGITSAQEKQFASFFTDVPPPPYQKYAGPNVRIRYFGHACILIETANCSILTDPVISYGYENSISRYTYKDIPDVIDYVVITHNHQDHILFETMLQLRHKIKQIIVPRNGDGSLPDPNLRLMLNHIGFNNVIELDEMQSVRFENCCITGIPFMGEHSDLNIKTKLCYHVAFERASMLLAADSCVIEPRLYDHIHRIVGDVDVLFLGMECDGAPLSWLYGPLLPHTLEKDKDRSRRLRGSNFKEGISLVDRFKPKEVYVYAMGQEPWLNYIMSLKYTEDSNPIVASNKLIKTCRERNIPAERLFGEKEILLNNQKDEPVYSPIGMDSHRGNRTEAAGKVLDQV